MIKRDIVIGVSILIMVCASFIYLCFIMFQPVRFYSLDDYGCDNVARMYATDVCVMRSESRMLFNNCFSHDAMRFWYDNNCRINATPVPCINIYDNNLSLSGGCCYPRNCWTYNASCNHNCEYLVMCYGNQTFPSYMNLSYFNFSDIDGLVK